MYTERGQPEMPRYFRLHADTWEAVNAALPPIQAAKVIYALERLFFEGVDPEDGSLPRSAQGMYDIQRQLVIGYRRNAINGARKKKTTQKPTQETTQKPTQFSTQKPIEVFDIPYIPLPAETEKVGGEGACKHPCNNNKQETINISNSISLVTKGRPHRAAAGAAQGRPAPALPSRAEFDRICRKLEDEGLDAITDAEREAYHAGYAAYKCE